MNGQAITRAAPLLRRPTLRGLRLASGWVLFAYVLTHLLDHALGNVSLAAMEQGLDWASAIWLGPVGLLMLYGAMALHAGLGLAALYERRSLRMRVGEAMQLVLGLAIPVLLVNHVIATRVAGSLYGIAKGYPQVLYGFWVGAPVAGVWQTVLLLVAWTHGCLGLHYWLRLRRWYPGLRGVLLAAAVLVPALALLGFAQGGRAVAALAADPAWRAENLGPSTGGTPAQNDAMTHIRDVFLLGYASALLLVLAARTLRTRRPGHIALTYPDGRILRVPRGLSVLDASRLHGVPHASVCGGKGRCSTCRVRVLGAGAGQLAAPDEGEHAVLERIGARPGIRLACQLRPRHDLTVVPLLSPHARAEPGADARPAAAGEERFVVAAFIDMRGSTSLAAAHLPFDTVFIINRFLSAVAGAITAQGGTPNQFLGDGLLALFGLAEGPEAAARHALAAVAAVERAVAGLNAAMASELDAPIRYGVGLHAGTAVVGEIGDGAHAAFTAIGDPVNVASRLQDLTKTYGCAAVVSEAVYRAAGAAPEGEARAVTVRGASTELAVRLLGLREKAPAL